MRTHSASVAALRWALVLAVGRAGAVAPAARPPESTLNVELIAASKAPGGLDPRLSLERRSLREFSFNSYRLIRNEAVTVVSGQPHKVELASGYSLEIALHQSEASGPLKLHLHVQGATAGRFIDSEYELPPKGSLLLGGMKAGDETLLVVLRPSTGR